MKMLDGSEVDDKGNYVTSVLRGESAPSEPAIPREKQPHAVPEGATLHWRIWYVDGTCFSSKDGPWEAAKSDGVVAVVQALNDEPPDVQIGTPYYWKFDDWVCRVWDPTLYLRQTGLVKFGRWAPHKRFTAGWLAALRAICDSEEKYRQIIDTASIGSGGVCTTQTVGDRETGVGFALYYDDGTVVNGGSWEQAPSDGVLCAVYSVVYSGIKLHWAMRRYTYYYWRGHELRNTDDLDEVLGQFPQCKRGQPAFTGKSYRHQAESITAAMHDTLEGVR
jgi:hypothetical protein